MFLTETPSFFDGRDMKRKGHILIVDDDVDVLFTAKTILKHQYEHVSTESSPNRLETLLKKESIDLVILDMNFKAGITSGNEGLYWLRRIKELNPDVHVLMNTAYGDIQLAVESMKLGAVDFLVKPWEKETLLATTHTIFELRKTQKKVVQLKERENVLETDINQSFGELIFQSAAMEKVMKAVKRVAATDATVLLLGENGTGKEVVARAIHKLSNRSEQPMIKVDLGAITETLFESEIFGHVKGAFTDAKEDRAGRFEIADGGTLFLDEIGNLNIGMQSKLLSVLQNQMVSRVGSSKSIPFDVRVIGATNMPLEEMVTNGEFRQDLLYRINTVEVHLPPLRERLDDIEMLVNHFLDKYTEKYQKVGIQVSEEALENMKRYHWPGNIRELQHAVERAVIMAETRKLKTADFLITKKKEAAQSDTLNVDELEKMAIVKAIEQSDGNMSQAAQLLGLGRTTLYRKMKKYNIEG